MPAIQGNLNRSKHGGDIARLTLGKLPKSMARHVRQACAYRRELEALVVHAKGGVDYRDAHIIDEACQAELHAGICRWILRTKLSNMQPCDIARCSEQILKAKVLRNKAFDRLGLDRIESDSIEALYAPAEPDDVSVTEEANNATQTQPRARGGFNMLAIDAMNMFDMMEDRSWWHIPATEGDNAVSLMAALATLSGWIDDCYDEIDLQAACHHGFQLLMGGVITPLHLSQEAVRIEGELEEWALDFKAEMVRISECN